MNNISNNFLQVEVTNQLSSENKLDKIFNMNYLKKKGDWVLAEPKMPGDNNEADNWDLPEYNNPYPVKTYTELELKKKMATHTLTANNGENSCNKEGNLEKELCDDPAFRVGQFDDTEIANQLPPVKETNGAPHLARNTVNGDKPDVAQKKNVTFDFSAEYSTIKAFERDLSTKMTISEFIKKNAGNEYNFKEKNIDLAGNTFNNNLDDLNKACIPSVPFVSEDLKDNQIVNELLVKMRKYLGDFCIIAQSNATNQHIKHPCIYPVDDVNMFRYKMRYGNNLPNFGQNNIPFFNPVPNWNEYYVAAAMSNNVNYNMNNSDMNLAQHFYSNTTKPAVPFLARSKPGVTRFSKP